MTPSLTPSGLILALVGSAFVVAGTLAGAWPLLAIGFTQVSALLVLYLLMLPASAMLRRQNLELAWWVPVGQTGGGALVADRPMSLQIMLRNRTPFRLAVQRIQVMASSAIQMREAALSALLLPRQEVTLEARFTPLASGHWFFQGALVDLTDRFRVFRLQLYYPNLMEIKVFPYLGTTREPIPFQPRTGASHERAGLRLLRQRGLGSDLREIRNHIPGDPFKRIAWKATARTRKLMVREFESEVLVTHWLLLDISSTMRSRRPGRSKLDYGLTLCAAFARLAIDAGDRVGLITFDHRVYNQVKPGDGQTQLYRIVERLMELHNIVDEDLTDLTDEELYGAVAQYMAYQEGVDVSLQGKAPSPDIAQQAGLVLGPRGEVYDRGVMIKHLDRVLEQRRHSGSRRWWSRIVSSDPQTARLRLFCRLSGLEIPYRRQSPLVSKDAGMAEAVHRAGLSRQSQFILLISDLEEIGDLNTVLDSLRLARKRGHSIVAAAPLAPAFYAPTDEAHSERVQSILALRAERQRREVARRIERAGISVLSTTPKDVLPLVLRRLARLRVARTGRGF